MDSVVDNYILVDTEIHEDLEHIEQLVFSGTRDIDATSIYRLKREVLEIRRASQPLAEAMERLFVQPHRAIVDRDGSEVMAFFRDVRDHLLKVNDHVESYDRLLSDILGAYLAQISVAQNNDMRKISAWVAIAAVPTMVAGIYGMNFRYIPELEASVAIGGHGGLLRLLRRARGHGRGVRRPVPRVQAVRLALSGGMRRDHRDDVDRPSGRGEDARRQGHDEHDAQRDAVPDERLEGVGRDEPQQPGDRRIRTTKATRIPTPICPVPRFDRSVVAAS